MSDKKLSEVYAPFYMRHIAAFLVCSQTVKSIIPQILEIFRHCTIVTNLLSDLVISLEYLVIS